MAYVEITTRVGCKNACTYCPHEMFRAAYRSRSSDLLMRFETFRECIDKIPADLGICFAGMGEPWLNPDCTRMVRYAHSAGHRVHIFTTGVGLYSRDIDALKEIPFEQFVVHLPTAEGWESISVDQTYLSTLRCLRQSGCVTRWHCHSSTVNPLIGSVIGEEACSRGDHYPSGQSEA